LLSIVCNEMNKKGISVIICCYNSSKRIAPTLQHIADQRGLEDISWEVIIVDNCSVDNTIETIQSEWAKLKTNATFTITEQRTPGVAFARKTGVYSAQYEYIVFCDDDNWLSPEYLKISFDLMGGNSSIGIISGQSTGQSSIDFPEWWEDYKLNYAVAQLAEESGDISHHTFFWTAGLVIRKQIALKVFDNNFPLFLTGRKGDKLTSGEDSEICLRVLLLNFKAFYEEKMKFIHFISPERLTLEYRDKLIEGGSLANIVLDKYIIVLKYLKDNFLIKSVNSIYLILKLCMVRFNLFREPKSRILMKLYTYWKFNFMTEDSQIKDIVRFSQEYS
jgi:glycosyltransferase involved in cell wall biosynthesis